jgi:hypothetical protein
MSESTGRHHDLIETWVDESKQRTWFYRKPSAGFEAIGDPRIGRAWALPRVREVFLGRRATFVEVDLPNLNRKAD